MRKGCESQWLLGILIWDPLPTVSLPSRLCLSRWQITVSVFLSVSLSVRPPVCLSICHPPVSVWALCVPYMNLHEWTRSVFHSTFLNVRFSHLSLCLCHTPALSISTSDSLFRLFAFRISLCFTLCALKSPSSFFFFNFFLFMFFNLSPPFLFPSVCLALSLMTAASQSYRWVAMTMRLCDQILKISLPFPEHIIYLFI